MKEKTNWHPGTLLELSGSYWHTCTLHAGVKLGLFTRIGRDCLDLSGVNAELNANEEGLSRLLNALCAMGLLKKDGQGYANTPESYRFLSKDSDSYIGYMIMHHHHLLESWGRIDEAVMQGGPIRKRSPEDKDQWRESFLMGMFNIAMAIAPGLAKELDFTGCSRLLDMGGGPGTFAIHFCLANPGMTASVYDLPTTEPFARKTIERFNTADRIDFIAGDYTKDEFPKPGEYDAAWLSHILHGEGSEQAGDVVRKAVSALKPGGKILIHEFILTDTMDAPLFPALFSINMYLGTGSGQSYSQGQLTDMLRASGVGNIQRLAFEGPTQSGILAGVKQG